MRKSGQVLTTRALAAHHVRVASARSKCAQAMKPTGGVIDAGAIVHVFG